MASVKYDSSIIEKVAERLNARARSIVVVYMVVGLLLGLVLGLVIRAQVGDDSSITLVSVLLFTAAGAALGSERALNLRLQAQVLLCQVSIERNTHSMLHRMSEQVRGPDHGQASGELPE